MGASKGGSGVSSSGGRRASAGFGARTGGSSTETGRPDRKKTSGGTAPVVKRPPVPATR